MYIEICTSLNHRGKFIPAKQLGRHLKENQELYKSYFVYDETLVKKIQAGKDIGEKNTSGKMSIPYLILDIDRGERTFQELLTEVKNICDVLIKEYDLEDNFQLWFSGRGFHIHLPNIFDFQPSNNLPDIVRSTIEAIFPVVDTKPIHKRGLIRVGGSMNLKSSLYKVAIDENEIWFLTEEQVIEWSSKNRKIDLVKFKDFPLYPDLVVFPKVNAKEELTPLNFKSVPSNDVTCIQRIIAEGPIKGKRHEQVLRITSYLKRKNIQLEAVLAVVYWFVGEKTFEWSHIVNSVYQKNYEYGCQDYMLKQHCSPTCMFYEKRNYLPEIFGLDHIQKKYKQEMVAGWKDNSINMAGFFGIYGEKGMWLRPGHVVGIIADTGNSKSALIQNLCIKYKDFGRILYLDTEMKDTELYERFIQIENELDVFEVREKVLEENNNFGDSLGHISYLKSVPPYEDLVPILKNIKPKILVIDVIDDLKMRGGRGVSEQEDMFTQFKKLLNELNVITFMVHHVTKSSVQDQDGRAKKINKHAAKGSSAFEQKVDLLIGIDGDATTPYRTVRHLKGRSTSPFETNYRVNSETFKYEIIKEIN